MRRSGRMPVGCSTPTSGRRRLTLWRQRRMTSQPTPFIRQRHHRWMAPASILLFNAIPLSPHLNHLFISLSIFFSIDSADWTLLIGSTLSPLLLLPPPPSSSFLLLLWNRYWIYYRFIPMTVLINWIGIELSWLVRLGPARARWRRPARFNAD